MILLREESEYRGAPCAVAMGMFDGMHLGHQELIRETLRAARECGAPCVAYTYANHPLSVLRPQIAPKPLMTAEEKAAEMERLGVTCLIERPFTRELADTDARTFLTRLCKCLSPVVIAAGYNHTFGKGGLGNAELLCEMAAELGYRALIVKPVCVDGEPVSSSRIRALLRAGDRETACMLLGRPLPDVKRI